MIDKCSWYNPHIGVVEALANCLADYLALQEAEGYADKLLCAELENEIGAGTLNKEELIQYIRRVKG